MAENPYAGILSVMQQQGSINNPPTICLGEVISPEPNLTIKTEDLLLDKDDILISDILLEGYEREYTETESKGKMKITGTLQSATQDRGGGSGDASFSSHNHDINNDATLEGSYESDGETKIRLKKYLKTGDLLAMMPTANRQQYIVLCRVVSL